MSRFFARIALAGWVIGSLFASASTGWAQATRSSGSSGSIGTGSSIGLGSSVGSTGSLGGGSSISGSGMGTGSSGIGTGTAGQAGSSVGVGTSISILSPTASGAASSNPVGAYYANPLSAGKPGGTGKITGLWAPLYTATTTTTATGITGTLNSTPGMNANQAGSILNRRGPAYSIAVTFPYEPPTASQLRTEAQDVLARSSALSMRDSIKVKVDGQTLVLEGQVRSDQERRLAENMVRLTPGARSIQNNLQIIQTGPPPRQAP